MIRFIKYFFYEWRNYPHMKAFAEDMKKRNPEGFAEMEKADAKRGIKPYKNRFDYAWRMAKIRAKDCRYTRICRKYGGDCEKCSKKKGR